MSFNCTFMELKLKKLHDAKSVVKCFNCTFMELKLNKSIAELNKTKF